MGQETKIKLTVNSHTELTANLVDNSSVTALIDLLKDSPMTIEMRDYGNMEKVGSIGTSKPRNDEQITTEPGDIILYQGNALVIYYASNSWNFTRLGKIDSLNRDELKAVLGDGNVTVKLELADTTTSIEDDKSGEKLYRVYPNPAGNYFEVKGQFANLSLFDNKGIKLSTTRENIIDVTHLDSGIYFLKIESTNQETVIRKIVKRSL